MKTGPWCMAMYINQGKLMRQARGMPQYHFRAIMFFNVKLFGNHHPKSNDECGESNPMGPFVRKARPHAMYAGMYSLRRKDIRATVSAKTRVVSVTALLARTIISREVAHMKAPVRAGFSPISFLVKRYR